MNSVSVIICSYNEEKNVVGVVDQTLNVLGGFCDDYEVIVVDDGSVDRSLSILRQYYAANPKIKIIVHPQNQGIGAALKDGYALAEKSYVTFLPADGQISPGDVYLL